MLPKVTQVRRGEPGPGLDTISKTCPPMDEVGGMGGVGGVGRGGGVVLSIHGKIIQP